MRASAKVKAGMRLSMAEARVGELSSMPTKLNICPEHLHDKIIKSDLIPFFSYRKANMNDLKQNRRLKITMI